MDRDEDEIRAGELSGDRKNPARKGGGRCCYSLYLCPYDVFKHRIKQLKPTLTPHYFRHNFATLLFEAGVEPLIAMKILGHTDYQTTANIYTHLNSEMLKKSSVDMEEVFRRKQEAKGVLAKAKSAKEKRSRKPAVDASLPWAGRF